MIIEHTSPLKELKAYLSKRENAIQEILNLPGKSYSIESYHKLRVEIKKLRALATLLENCVKGFNKQVLFAPVKEIFQQAGKVREIHIENDVLERFYKDGLLKAYQKKQKNELKKEISTFRKLLEKEFLVEWKAVGKGLQAILDHVKEKKINKFMEQSKEGIRDVLKEKKIPKSKLHDLRKKLKAYNYCRKMFLQKEMQIGAKKNVDLSELLGKWHDLEVTIEKLKKAVKVGKYDSEDKLQMEEVSSTLKKESKLMLRAIRKSMKSSKWK